MNEIDGCALLERLLHAEGIQARQRLTFADLRRLGGEFAIQAAHMEKRCGSRVGALFYAWKATVEKARRMGK